MRAALSASLLSFCLVFVPQTLRAQEDPPSILIQIGSVNDILKQMQTLANWSGKGEEAKQGIGFIQALASEKGIEGLALDRPFGLSLRFSENTFSSPVHLMIPIADAESFIQLLKFRLRIDIKDEKDGVFSFPIPNAPISAYGKFANGYCYLTALSPVNLSDKELPDPKKLFGTNVSGLMRMDFRLDRIPKTVKNLILGQLETQLQQAKRADANETKLQTELKGKLVDSIAFGIKSMLMDTKSVRFQLGIDSKTEEFVIESEIQANADSFMKSTIESWAKRNSTPLGAIANLDLLQAGMVLKLPESCMEVLAKVVEETLNEGVEKSPDVARGLAEKLANALKPTFKNGELDLGFGITIPKQEKHMALMFAVKIKEGKQLESAIKDVLAQLPGEIQNWFELDAKKVGDVTLHAFNVGDFVDANLAKVIGEKPKLWFCIEDQCIRMVVGPTSDKLIEQSITTKSQTGTLAKLEVSLAKMAPFFEMEQSEAIQAIVDTIFGKSPGDDSIKVSIIPGENLKIRVAVKGKIFQLMSALETLKNEDQ